MQQKFIQISSPPSLEPDLYHPTDNNSSLNSDDDPAQVVERSITIINDNTPSKD